MASTNSSSAPTTGGSGRSTQQPLRPAIQTQPRAPQPPAAAGSSSTNASGNMATVTITETQTQTDNAAVLPLTLRARPSVTWYVLFFC